MVYCHKVSNTDQLKCTLIDRWIHCEQLVARKTNDGIKERVPILNFVWTNSV